MSSKLDTLNNTASHDIRYLIFAFLYGYGGRSGLRSSATNIHTSFAVNISLKIICWCKRGWGWETLQVQFVVWLSNTYKEYCCIAQHTENHLKKVLFCGQIEFEDESWLSVRREDVYKVSEELPLKVQQRLVSKEQ